MRKLVLLGCLAAALAWPVGASATCNGNFAAGTICGNPASGIVPPVASALSPILDRSFGTAQGTVLNRGASAWSATVTPVLGNPGSTTGSLGIASSGGGTATLGVPSISGAVNFTLPASNGTNGQVLGTDGAGNTSWIVNSSGGTVSSVALGLPLSVFLISGSPVTTTGTLTGSFINQSANVVFAGPTTGSAATPAFRALVGADLPTPGLSSLGGIQAINAVSHEWVNSINTSGVAQLTQPAFSDISGVITPAQCPPSGTSTLGCVRSYASVTHQWINTISNSGIPASSQPGFTDISGTAALSQLPVIANNTVLSNISGVSAAPGANILTAIINSSFGSAQGSILYRGASAWTVLTPGTSGQALETQGAAANPVWASVSGTGTVTSIICNGGLSGGTITTSGTCALASISAGTVLANVTGGSAAPIANTPSAVLDVIDATEGDVLYRGASTWAALGPGTNGQVLTTQGAGSTPVWANNGVTTLNGLSGILTIGPAVSSTGTVITMPVPLPQGRLTLQTGVPVMNTTQANKATIFYDCFRGGNLVPIFDGTVDTVLPIGSCEISTALQSSGTGVLNTASVFDVWGVNASGSLVICTATNGSGGGWASDTAGSNTARGTGYSQLDFTTRRYVTNKNALAHCYTGATDRGSVSANRATYLGTVYTSSAGQVTWQYGTNASVAGLFGVWNAYNRVNVASQSALSTSSWTHVAFDTWREANGTTTVQTTYVYGLNEDSVAASYNDGAEPLGSGGLCAVAVGIDSTTLPTGQLGYVQGGASVGGNNTANATYHGYPGLGVHVAAGLEAIINANCDFFSGQTTLPGSVVYQGFSIELRM